MKRPRANRGGARARRRRPPSKQKRQPSLPPPHPPCPSSFRCHQCEQNHWTIECPRVLREPHRYPKLDVVRGCYQCGLPGHNPLRCPVRREKCFECGGMHNAQHCPYKYPPQEWHEFYDTDRKHTYYCNNETQAISWDMPANPLDSLFWHCDACCILMPDEVGECVECHTARPATVPLSSDDEGDEEEDASSDEESTSASDDEEVVADVEVGEGKAVQPSTEDPALPSADCAVAN